MSLTRTQLAIKANPKRHVQSQTRFFEFDVSLTKIQYLVEKAEAGTHVQSQTHF